VPTRDERHQDLVEHIPLTYDSPPYLLAQPDRCIEKRITPAGGGALAGGQRRAQRTGRRRR